MKWYGESLERFFHTRHVRYPRLRLLLLVLLGEHDFVAEAVKRIESIRRSESLPVINMLPKSKGEYGSFDVPFDCLEEWERQALLQSVTSYDWRSGKQIVISKPRRYVYLNMDGRLVETFDEGQNWYALDSKAEQRLIS